MAVTTENTAAMAAAAAQAHQAQAAAILTAQGQHVVPRMNQLIQALQNIVPAVRPATQPTLGPACIKMALPDAFTRTTKEAKQFLQNCENYFTLNAMNTQQRILFTLQLIKGDAAHWKQTMLTLLDAPKPPPWNTDWELFKGVFCSRFADPHKKERAIQKLLNNKVVQFTSIKKFLDKVVQTCKEASWHSKAQWMEIARNGLKKDVAQMIRGLYPPAWEDFRNQLIAADEEVQHLRGWERTTPPKKNSSTNTSASNPTKKEPKPNNSCFKPSEEEKKEHVEQNLCFKCHKKGHSSKDCHRERTVYSDFKKKKAQVAAITPKDPKGKGKAVATIKEVEEYSDAEEDFPEGD
jgi:hypothetical protein